MSKYMFSEEYLSVMQEQFGIPDKLSMRSFDPKEAEALVHDLLTHLLTGTARSLLSNLVSAIPDVLALASANFDTKSPNMVHLVLKVLCCLG